MSQQTKNIFARDGTYTAHYKNMCWKKLWYQTEYQAVKAAVKFMESAGKFWKQSREYRCQYCRCWHLTSQNPDITLTTLRKLKLAKRNNCGRRYLTEQAANQAARDTGKKMLRCLICDYWHIYEDK